MFLSSPARCTGVRPYCLSVVRGDAPWLRRVWTQSEWPRRAASARAVLPISSPWSTSLSPCSSTSRAWAWPWYAWREKLLFKNVNLKKKNRITYYKSFYPFNTDSEVQRAPGMWRFRVILVTAISVQQLEVKTKTTWTQSQSVHVLYQI